MCACAFLNPSFSSPWFDSIEKEMDFVDWRAELGRNFRQDVLIKVVDKLQSLVPCSSDDVPSVRNGLNSLAIKFEKNIYEKAKSKSEYLAKIYQRLTRTKNSFYPPNALTKTSSSAGGLTEQGMLPDVLLFDTHPGSQLPQHLLQHSQNQQTTLGLPPLNGSSLQPNHHGSSSFSPTQNNNGLPAEPSNFQLPLNPKLATSFQHHQHVGGRSCLDLKISEPSMQYEQQNAGFRWQPGHSLLSQHNMDTNMYPLGATSYGGGFPSSQQELGGFPSNLFSVQHVSSCSLHEEQMTNNSSHSTLLHQSCNKKTNVNEAGLHGFQISSALNSQRLSDGNNPLLKALASDWQDLISQLQSMRSIYLPQLTSLYNRARAACATESNVDQQEKYKHARLILEKMIKFLCISDNDIMRFPKQKVVHYQKLIVQYVDSFHGRNLLPSSNIRRPDPMHSGSTCIPRKQNLRLQQSGLHARIEPVGQSIPGSPSRSFISQHYTSLNASDGETAHLHLPRGPLSTKHQNSTKLAQSSSMRLELLQGMIQPRMLEGLQQKSDQVIHSVLRQVDNAASETHQQYCSTGKYSQKPNQSVASTILHQSHDDSTHKSMRSSLMADQTGPPISKSGMQLPASPPLADSDSSLQHIGADNLSEASLPLSCTDNNVGPKITAGSCKVQHQTNMQGLAAANNIIGLPASPLLFDGPACKFSLSVERLVKAVTEASHEVLVTSIHDMFTIIDITEGIPNASGVGDPDYMTTCMNWNSFASVFSSHGERSARKMKRHLDFNEVETLLIDENDGSTQFCHSTTIYRTKRPRIERKQDLLSEIRKTNSQMVETVIEMVYDASEGAESIVAYEGTTVRFTYSPVALGANFKSLVSSMMLPSVAVKLLIPSNYPDSSPEILDDLPVSSKGNEDFTEKAKCRFKRLLRSLPEPMSLGDVAQVWDDCARELFSEFAYVSLGEVCTRSEVDAWESIAAA